MQRYTRAGTINKIRKYELLHEIIYNTAVSIQASVAPFTQHFSTCT